MKPTTADTARTPAPLAQDGTPVSPPWWRVGMVWLVLAGPAVVVVAGIGTAVIAIRGADRVVTEPAALSVTAPAELPAVQGRNHAATPR